MGLAIIENDHEGYQICVKKLNMLTLSQRRSKICERFANKLLEHKDFQKWFQPCENRTKARKVKKRNKF